MCSTARATTTAGTAARCSPAARSPDRRTCRRSRSRPRSACPTLLRFLLRAGLTTFDRTPSYYGLGVTLGNAEVRLDELVAAYATFARGGDWIEPTGRCRTDASASTPGTASAAARLAADGVLDHRHALRPDAREFIFGRGGSLEFPFPVAVKTGTSQAYHDNWTIGYTRDVTVGVWVGNFDRTPLVAPPASPARRRSSTP